jgi:hypothetical protein
LDSSLLTVSFLLSLLSWTKIVAIGTGIHVGGFAFDNKVIQMLAFGILFAVKGYRGHREGVVSSDGIVGEGSSSTSEPDSDEDIN